MKTINLSICSTIKSIWEKENVTIRNEKLTENFWINNEGFKHLFMWSQCYYNPNTFFDFIKDGNCISVNISVNIAINITTIDTQIHCPIPCNPNELFSKVINKLKTKKKKLELIIEEKYNKINQLENKIKEFENISNNNIYRIKELEKEIEKYKNYCLLPGEELISINFISTDQTINFNTFAKKTDKFIKLESALYEYYPRYIDTENFFLVNGMKVNKHRTLEDNKIKDNDIITLKDFNELI